MPGSESAPTPPSKGTESPFQNRAHTQELPAQQPERAPLVEIAEKERRQKHLPIARRNREHTPVWEDITPRIMQAASHPPTAQPPKSRVRLWMLVLEAQGYPFTVEQHGQGRSKILVPPAWFERALHDIIAVEQEELRPGSGLPKSIEFGGALCLALVLFVWHGLRFQWFGTLALPVPPFPAAPDQWPALFGLDAYRTTMWQDYGQVWRTVTALFVHADTRHLLGNMLFCFLFFAQLFHRIGHGAALLLVLLASATANYCNALLRPSDSISIGFSTAVFGSVGCLMALAGYDIIRHNFSGKGANTAVSMERLRKSAIPLAAGLAILAFLGGAGEEKTDFQAHSLGLLCGTVLTALACIPARHLAHCPKAVLHVLQWCAALVALVFVCVCWHLALRY